MELDEYEGFDHVDPHAWVTCPFDSNHVMPWKKFQTHLMHCRMVHVTEDHRTCPYNFTHILLKEDFDRHLLECPDIPENSRLVDYGFGPVVVTTDPGMGRKAVSGTWLTARPPVPQMMSAAYCKLCDRKLKTFVDLRAHNVAKHSIIEGPPGQDPFLFSFCLCLWLFVFDFRHPPFVFVPPPPKPMATKILNWVIAAVTRTPPRLWLARNAIRFSGLSCETGFKTQSTLPGPGASGTCACASGPLTRTGTGPASSQSTVTAG